MAASVAIYPEVCFCHYTVGALDPVAEIEKLAEDPVSTINADGELAFNDCEF